MKIMKTLCYYLNGDFENALQEIMELIPCLVSFASYSNDLSVAITCREEDAAFVERKLQDFV